MPNTVKNSLIDKLRIDGSDLSRNNGETPVTPDFAESTLHKEYSLEANPSKLEVRPRTGNLPEATSLSNFDSIEKYKDNLPEGSSV
tara:strand:- start:7513 stop:7770 length:258 start_codon:yes stop_codon:yes gene_type:complete